MNAVKQALAIAKTIGHFDMDESDVQHDARDIQFMGADRWVRSILNGEEGPDVKDAWHRYADILASEVQ